MIRNFVGARKEKIEIIESKKIRFKDYFYCFYEGQKGFQKFIFPKVVLRGLLSSLRLE